LQDEIKSEAKEVVSASLVILFVEGYLINYLGSIVMTGSIISSREIPPC